jgi:hypothetical protein
MVIGAQYLSRAGWLWRSRIVAVSARFAGLAGIFNEFYGISHGVFMVYCYEIGSN